MWNVVGWWVRRVDGSGLVGEACGRWRAGGVRRAQCCSWQPAPPSSRCAGGGSGASVPPLAQPSRSASQPAGACQPPTNRHAPARPLPACPWRSGASGRPRGTTCSLQTSVRSWSCCTRRCGLLAARRAARCTGGVSCGGGACRFCAELELPRTRARGLAWLVVEDPVGVLLRGATRGGSAAGASATCRARHLGLLALPQPPGSRPRSTRRRPPTPCPSPRPLCASPLALAWPTCLTSSMPHRSPAAPSARWGCACKAWVCCGWATSGRPVRRVRCRAGG